MCLSTARGTSLSEGQEADTANTKRSFWKDLCVHKGARMATNHLDSSVASRRLHALPNLPNIVVGECHAMPME